MPTALSLSGGMLSQVDTLMPVFGQGMSSKKEGNKGGAKAAPALRLPSGLYFKGLFRHRAEVPVHP